MILLMLSLKMSQNVNNNKNICDIVRIFIVESTLLGNMNLWISKRNNKLDILLPTYCHASSLWCHTLNKGFGLKHARLFFCWPWVTELVVPGWCKARDAREVWSSFGGAPLVALPAPPRLHKLLLKRGNTDVSHKVVPGRGTLFNHLTSVVFGKTRGWSEVGFANNFWASRKLNNLLIGVSFERCGVDGAAGRQLPSVRVTGCAGNMGGVCSWPVWTVATLIRLRGGLNPEAKGAAWIWIWILKGRIYAQLQTWWLVSFPCTLRIFLHCSNNRSTQGWRHRARVIERRLQHTGWNNSET